MEIQNGNIIYLFFDEAHTIRPYFSLAFGNGLSSVFARLSGGGILETVVPLSPAGETL